MMYRFIARSSVLASDGDPTQMDMAQNILSQLNEDLEFQVRIVSKD
jgi:hypothetical protein